MRHSDEIAPAKVGPVVWRAELPRVPSEGLVELGAACAEYMDRTLVNLPCKRVQCDEIWQFCYAKQKNLPESMKDKALSGSAPSGPGSRSAPTRSSCRPSTSAHTMQRTAYEFMSDLAGRLRGRIQLTTDGHPST